MKKILVLILMVLFFANNSYAEIGKSVDSFKKSSFATLLKIKQINVYTYPNENKRFHLADPKQVFDVEINTNPDGSCIISQSVTFPLTADNSLAKYYAAVAVTFVGEASGERVNAKRLIEFLDWVSEKPHGKEYEKRMGEYLIVTEILPDPKIWAIEIKMPF